MALIERVVQADGGGDHLTPDAAFDWIDAQGYTGAGNWPADGIRVLINDSAIYTTVVLNYDFRPGEARDSDVGLEIVAANGETPIFTAAAVGSARPFTLGASAGYLWQFRMAGITFTGTGSSQFGAYLYAGANRWINGVIEDCTFRMTGSGSYGLFRSALGGLRIRNNKFDGCTAFGIANHGVSTDEISNNEFIDCGTALYLARNMQQVKSNSFLRNTVGIIFAETQQQGSGRVFNVRANIFRANTTALVFTFADPGPRLFLADGLDYNIYHGNTQVANYLNTNYSTLAAWQAVEGSPDAHSDTDNPDFTSEVDGSENLIPTASEVLGGFPAQSLAFDKGGNARGGYMSTPGAWEGTYTYAKGVPTVAQVESGVTYGPEDEHTGAKTSGANLDIDLNPQVSAASVAFAIAGQTVNFVGGLTPVADISGISTRLAVYNDAGLSSLNATLIAATQADLSANVQKTWADINGSTVAWAPDAGDYWIEAFVNGGDPDVGSPDFILPFRVVHDFSTCVLAVVDDGDGSVTLTLTQNQDTNSDDQVSRIKYKLRGASGWTVHGTSQEGDGVISDLTGLVQTSTYQFIAQPYDSATGLEGPPSKVITVRMAASGEALIKQILAAVADQINNLGITDVDSSAISATVTIPPVWEDVTTAAVLVFTDGPETEPARSQVNLEIYRINLGLCEHVDGVPNEANMWINRQALVRSFVGSRLDSINNVYCRGETSASAVDLDALYEKYKWISVITLEFVILQARG